MNNVTIIVSPCAVCGAAVAVVTARMEDDAGVIEAVCQGCGRITSVSVKPEPDL